LDQLRELELGVASELAQTEANLLLPLIALHERTHLEYRRQSLDANPYHARATVYLQTQLYSEQLATTGERGVASDLFASLAGYFQEGSPGPGAVGLYSRALQFDPANEAALLGLATIREQTGRYRNALALLERLVETGAAHAEARLRMAINLERLGQRGEAERILEDLASESAPDWVLILAFQQLARIRMDQERFESAHTYLVRGLTRFPDDLGLAVGLTYVEERLGLEPTQPLATRLPIRDVAVSGLSARYRYARPGYHYIDAPRERLREAALRSLPDLARVLSGLAGPEK
jgi:tetratricopeptide (TPR) repeat protein